ncbi:MAG: DUF3299 domain-containing protein [Methylibium sp.]|uniref:DUF3299 domain-containing protein n=1 Tax=Methylibium sp. TaxID=2067992 RepID=UPI0017AFAA44|nr:DUF3299 domain-containing protein [Methylibium sp.]MBA3598857.1 DUF3299 domain-containing protein [Methylibium sp.]
MKMRLLLALPLLFACAAASLPAAAAEAKPPSQSAEFQEIDWDELVPKGWNPLEHFKDMDLGMLSDSSPRVLEAMRELRQIWDTAPTNSKMDGTRIKLPGYVVPLEQVKGELKEFLLVPYFGACIHSPPPPANQIIHVIADKPVKGFRTMDTVWVSGTLKTFRQDSAMGTSGYRMQAVVIDRYEPPAQR